MLVLLHVNAVNEPDEEFDLIIGEPVAIISPSQLSSRVDGSGVGAFRPLLFLIISLDLLVVLVSDPVVSHFRLSVVFSVPLGPVHVAERLGELLSRAISLVSALEPETSVGFGVSISLVSFGLRYVLNKDSHPVCHASNLLRSVNTDVKV